ncbi:hypothetical protein P8452_33420 [Trifolium repens]|nr:hypothetical protein P8452_33420 [Trifolium repens]
MTVYGGKLLTPRARTIYTYIAKQIAEIVGNTQEVLIQGGVLISLPHSNFQNHKDDFGTHQEMTFLLHKLLFRFCSHWRVSVIVVLVLTLLRCRSMDRVLLLTIARKQYLIKVGRDIRPVMRGAYTLFKDGEILKR